jgi:hypothetical protein
MASTSETPKTQNNPGKEWVGGLEELGQAVARAREDDPLGRAPSPARSAFR